MTDTVSRTAAPEDFYLVAATDTGHWECLVDPNADPPLMKPITAESGTHHFCLLHWSKVRGMRYYLEMSLEREIHAKTRDEINIIVRAEKAIKELREAVS